MIIEAPPSDDDPELINLLTLRHRVSGLVNVIGAELVALAQSAAPNRGVFQKVSPNQIMSRISDSVGSLPAIEHISISNLSPEERNEYRTRLKYFVGKLKEILDFLRG